MEQYGAIDLKNNARKNTVMGFIYSIALHALLVLLYVGWTWISRDNEKGAPQIFPRITNIADLMPPPSASKEQAILPGSLPANDISKPNFGIPVPVPDIQAPNETMPDNDIRHFSNTEPGNTIGVNPGGTDKQSTVTEKTDNVIPDRDEFIPGITQDAQPTQNIQSLIQYPDEARRANLEGKVTFSALIGKDGRVEQVLIEKSDYEVFNQPVIDAVSKVRFTPARQGETPVRVWFTQTVHFRMQ